MCKNNRGTLALLVLALNCGVSFAADCNFMEEAPQPEWVSKQPSREGFYVGVGSAEKGKNEREQKDASYTDALSSLAKEIEVAVQSSYSESISDSGKGSSKKSVQTVEAKAEVKVNELLNDAKPEEWWLNRTSCQLWTLVSLPKESIKSNKNFRMMKALYEQSKTAGSQDAIDMLAEAKSLLSLVEFSYIHVDNNPKYWKDEIDKAIEKNQGFVGKKKNVVMAIFKKSDKSADSVDIPATVVQKIAATIAKLKGGWTDLSNQPCVSNNECLKIAEKNGSEHAIIVSCSGMAKQSNLGSFKGAMTVELSEYEVKVNRQIGKPQQLVSEIISPFSKEDLDWNLAVEKLINSGKLSALNN